MRSDETQLLADFLLEVRTYKLTRIIILLQTNLQHVFFCTDPPSPLVLTITPSAPGPITINEMDTLVLTCGISDSDQIASIQWLRGGALLTTGVSHSPDALSLAIASAGFADGGVYTCSARSVSGINVTASISVIVQGERSVAVRIILYI